MNWLGRQALVRPSAVAVRAPDRTLTYAELAAAAARGAGALAAAGAGPGDRVAVRLPNRADHAVAVHAVTWLGGVLVPVHLRLAPGEAAALLAEAGTALLVADAGDPLAAAALPCPILDAGRLAEETPGAPSLVAPAPQPADGPHSLLFTSGTTGRPRPVPLTHGNHLASAAASAFNLGLRPDDDWLCPLPLAHVGGLAVLLRSVLYGTAVTLLDGFDPAAVAERLRSGAVTHASLVPTMLRRLLEAVPGDGPLGSRRLRAVLLGGGPVEADLVARALERGLPVLGTYGMTETASQVATVPPEAAARKPGAAGPALPGAEVEVRTGTGEAAAPGQTGEIH
ncbi:MAG TPA: AMP-binding protein, partial [Thermoanaerobaculia bacterium]